MYLATFSWNYIGITNPRNQTGAIARRKRARLSRSLKSSRNRLRMPGFRHLDCSGYIPVPVRLTLCGLAASALALIATEADSANATLGL
jgi:hypothetical protein